MNIKNTKGFTLVELLVVMAIIATIAVISVPPLMEHIKSSRDTVRVAHVKQIEQAINTYAISNWEYPKPTDFNDLKDILKDELPRFPIDPRDQKEQCVWWGKCWYTYQSNWIHYMITTKFETQKYVNNFAKKDWIDDNDDDDNIYHIYDDLTGSKELGTKNIIDITAPDQSNSNQSN